MDRIESAAEDVQRPDLDQTSLYDAASWTGLPVPSESSDQLIGTTLHHTYIVERVLGEGGMGRVYEARHTRLLNKRFAIKVLHAHLVPNTDLEARFHREAEAAASINHPGVVGIYDIGRTPQGWPYMVCEHLSGIDLYTHIKRAGPLPLVSVAHIGRRLCEALEAAHEKGVIHRDLKPHNIFLSGDFSHGVPERPRVKVLDFGLSRFLDRDSELTKTGVVMGTPGYMSPEQAHGHQTDHRTDVYGIGAILYACATGRAPFVEETPQMTVLAVMSREPERPRIVEPSVSEALEVVIQRAMNKEPEERYPDISELSMALTKLEANPLVSLMPTTEKDGRKAPSPEEARSARLRLALLLTSAVLLVASATASIIAGTLSLRGKRIDLTVTEIVLLMALAAMSIFPMVLLVRHFRRRVWTNSARVVDCLQLLRTPLLAGLCAYGLSALLVRFADELLGGLFSHDFFGQPPGVGYRGFSITLPLIGLLAALAAVANKLWWSRRRPLRRWLFGPVLAGAAVVGSCALIHTTLSVRAKVAPAQSAALAAQMASAPAIRPEMTNARSRSASTEDTTQANAKTRAPDDELAVAIAQGADALNALAQRFPLDPELLRALVMAYASKANTLVEALQTAKRLLAVAPEQRVDPEIRYIISSAAQNNGAASDLAFELMAEDMKSAGADLLYDLMLRKPALEEKAQQKLAEARQNQLFSPALAIAYDLRYAPSCSSRLKLLPRALELGDERSLSVLSNLSSRPGSCGKRKHGACRVPCEKEAPQFTLAIERISRRLKSNGKGS